MNSQNTVFETDTYANSVTLPNGQSGGSRTHKLRILSPMPMPIRLRSEKPLQSSKIILAREQTGRAARTLTFLGYGYLQLPYAPVLLKRGLCSLCKESIVEQVAGIEPALSAWKADVLPLNHTYKVVALKGAFLRCHTLSYNRHSGLFYLLIHQLE